MLHWRLRDLVATQPVELVLGPVGARVDLELGDRHRGAHADLVAALDGDRYFRLLDALDTVLAEAPLTARAGKPARTQLPALVGRAAGRVDRAARAVAGDRTQQERNQGLPRSARARNAPGTPVGDRKCRRVMRQDFVCRGLGPSGGAGVGNVEGAAGQVGGGGAHTGQTSWCQRRVAPAL